MVPELIEQHARTRKINHTGKCGGGRNFVESIEMGIRRKKKRLKSQSGKVSYESNFTCSRKMAGLLEPED